VWRIWESRTQIKNLPYQQKSLAYMTGQVNRVVNDSQFAPMWSFTRLTCAWVHLDNALAALAPELNYLNQLKVYLRHSERRENFAKLVHMPSRIASTAAALHQVPKRTAEYTLFQEALLRRQAQVVQGSASKLDAVIAAGSGLVSFFLLIAGIFSLLVFSIRRLHIPIEPVLGPQLTRLAGRVPDMSLVVWMLLFSALTFLIGYSRKQKKRFERQEFGQKQV
jgi:hypothetical protein